MGVLPDEKTGAPSLTRRPLPLLLNGAFCRPKEIAQHLPPDCRVSVEKPLEHFLADSYHRRIVPHEFGSVFAG
jgi:hypothetical protein